MFFEGLKGWCTGVGAPRSLGAVLLIQTHSGWLFLLMYRDGILGHQFDKILEYFAPCYSQSLLQYWWILKKIIHFSSFKNPYKKIRETRKLESIHRQHFVERKNEDRKPDKTRVREDSSLCPETSTKNDVPFFAVVCSSLQCGTGFSDCHHYWRIRNPA